VPEIVQSSGTFRLDERGRPVRAELMEELLVKHEQLPVRSRLTIELESVPVSVKAAAVEPDLAARAAQGPPDLLITVDNGIASVEGVAHANELGISVLVTDHHLPGNVLPAAACIVNPNQAGCGFPRHSTPTADVTIRLLWKPA
jgi:hypothetical protein